MDAGQPAPSEPAEEEETSPSGGPEPPVLRQHDVRDLVAKGFAIECIALWAEGVCRGADVTPHVDVVDVVAPEEAQLRFERLLDEKRRRPYELRIHPVADLVGTLQETSVIEASPGGDSEDAAVVQEVTGRCGEEDDGVRMPGPPVEEIEPASPFDINALAEVISATVGEGVGTIQASGRNLVALADPAAQIRIARFLDDLRSNAEEEVDRMRR